ncbi:chloride channel protein [Arenibaculum sp.]|jgi:CIC family chloride channel protein|uniref:chloride channel protein n=1 Tax=Arenibaculum sp. TaxID=2865862 RepID=UPI002E11AF65|nr:chloride channel protein [Arenibaculum sp.]
MRPARPLLRLFVRLRRLLRNDQLLLAVLALLLGGAAGLGALVFRALISSFQWLVYGDGGERWLAWLATLPWWHLLLAPAAGGLVVGIAQHRLLPGGRPLGIAHVMEATAHLGGRMPLGRGVAAAAMSAASIGVGASVGREGPVVHLGATLGSWLAGRLRLSPGLVRTLLGCGIASAVAASFNAPVAGVFFALEVVVGQYSLAAFAPIVLASVTGTAIARAVYGDYPAFSVPGLEIVSFWEFPAFVLLGVFGAALAALLMRGIFAVEDGFAALGRAGLPRWSWPAAGGLGVGAIALGFPQVLGVGYEVMDQALRGALPLGLLAAVLAAKLAATALSLGCGFSGGVFSPSLAVGATGGGAFGIVAALLFPDLASQAGVYAIVGMGAVGGAVLGAPISTILIVFELTGDYAVTLAVMVGTVTAGLAANALVGRSFFQWQLERRGIVRPGFGDVGTLATARVGDVMREARATVPAGAGLAAALDVLRAAPHGELPVVERGRLVGVLTATELACALARPFAGLTVGEVATRDVPVLDPSDDLRTAMALMAEHGLARVPVVTGDRRRIVGIAHERDVLLAWHRAVGRARGD